MQDLTCPTESRDSAAGVRAVERRHNVTSMRVPAFQGLETIWGYDLYRWKDLTPIEARETKVIL